MRHKLLIVLACLFLVYFGLISGCCGKARLTTETIVPGNPPMIVVEFPKGVKTTDIKVVEIEGYAEAVAPVPSQ